LAVLDHSIHPRQFLLLQRRQRVKEFVRCPFFHQALVSVLDQQGVIEKTCDVRITVIGQDVHAVELTAKELDGSQRCDIRRNNMDDVTYRTISLPLDVMASIKCLMGQYHLRYAAIDMAIGTDGKWYFFEVNSNGQWAWLDLAGITRMAYSFVKEFGA
jgi:hypothetical protein